MDDGYDSIESLDDISLSDIEVFERVLKYCAEARLLAFSNKDARRLIIATTNILRWNRGFPILNIRLEGEKE